MAPMDIRCGLELHSDCRRVELVHNAQNKGCSALAVSSKSDEPEQPFSVPDVEPRTSATGPSGAFGVRRTRRDLLHGPDGYSWIALNYIPSAEPWERTPTSSSDDEVAARAVGVLYHRRAERAISVPDVQPLTQRSK